MSSAHLELKPSASEGGLSMAGEAFGVFLSLDKSRLQAPDDSEPPIVKEFLVSICLHE